LRQNRQEHSKECPIAQVFQLRLTPLLDLYPPATSLDTDFPPCAALSHLPDSLWQAAAPFPPQSPSVSPPHHPESLQCCRGAKRGQVKQ